MTPSTAGLPPPATASQGRPVSEKMHLQEQPRPEEPPRRRGWVAGLSDDINLRYAYVPLLACCLVSGLCDSVAFNASGVFVSMQTGNTIFLALGASSLPANQPRLWLKAIVSIAAFWAGCFLFAQFRRLHAQRKVTLFLSCLVQTLLLVAAAALAQSDAVPAFGDSHLSPTTDEDAQAERARRENQLVILAPIALLACQFGGQIVTSRVLGFSEIPTNVLTSLYCDLLSDPLLWTGLGGNPKRNRRAAAFVLTVVGGIVGGWLQRSHAGMSTPLWIAAAIKLVISLSWLWWEDKQTQKKTVEAASPNGRAEAK